LLVPSLALQGDRVRQLQRPAPRGQRTANTLVWSSSVASAALLRKRIALTFDGRISAARR